MNKRLAAAALLGIAAGAVAWARTGPMEPFVDVSVRRAGSDRGRDLWDVRVAARGEDVEEIRVEASRGPVTIVGAVAVRDLGRGESITFRAEVDASAEDQLCFVRVSQEGRVSRTNELPLQETR